MLQPPFPDAAGNLPNPKPENADPRPDYAAEADRLTTLMMSCFWDDETHFFRAPLLSAEAVRSAPPTQYGYLFWPAITALHTLAAAEWYSRFVGGGPRYASLITLVYVECLERYYDRGATSTPGTESTAETESKPQAYNAWLHFPGNSDKYYDDNALAVCALLDCTLATDDVRYIDRAWHVMANFVFAGWSDPATEPPGGVTWGTDPSKPKTSMKAVSATAFAALAALRLAAYYPQYYPAATYFDRTFMIAWAKNALDWIWNWVRDADDLVRDGYERVVQPDGSTDWRVSPVKWSYNTGLTMRGYADHYRLAGDPESLRRARRLADAALDSSKRLFDGLVSDPTRNFWYDSTFFVHYLVADGLLALVRASAPPERDRYWTAIRRHANYIYWYLCDRDGMYFRNMRLWRIDDERYEMWRRLTGETNTFAARDCDADERSKDGTNTVVKTLLANAAVARLFWQIALPQDMY